MSDTKKAALLAALSERWLTPLEAAQTVGIFSLSQRVGEFRRAGHPVIDRWVTTSTGSRVKSYTLPQKETA